MKKNRFFVILGVVLVSLGLTACGSGHVAEKKPTAIMKRVEPVEVQPETEVTLIAVGDMNLARKVDRLMTAHGMDYPLKEVKNKLSQADFTFGNLECAVSERGEPLPGKGIWLRARPEVMPQLKESGFDILSIANNHSLDYDTEAFLDTLQHTLQTGILPVGGGENITEARSPRVVASGGMKIGFLAYTEMADMIWSYQYPRKLKATETLPGVAPFEYEAIIQDVQQLNDKVDIVVLSLHWGTEYSPAPSQEQRDQAHGFIDAGADIIIGHHPHVIQGIELYNRGLIAYSLGNFIFDQNWSDKTREGLVLEVTFKNSGINNAKLYPVIIRESQPRFEQTQWARNVAGKVQKYSRDLDTECEVREDPLEIVVHIPEQSSR